MTDIDHLDTETKILPVKEHNNMIPLQYLASCHKVNRPCHHIFDKPSPDRHIRSSVTKFLPSLQQQFVTAEIKMVENMSKLLASINSRHT